MIDEYLELQKIVNDNDGLNNAVGRSLSSTITKEGIKIVASGTTGYGTLSSNKPAVYLFTNVDYDVNTEKDDSKNIFSNSVDLAGGQIWTHLATLKCPNSNLIDQFGTSIDISDKTIVVGASYTDNSVGAAYIFDTPVSTSSLTWTQTSKLVASDGKISDFFGISVSTNEGYVFVGASGHSSTGAVYVFKSIQGDNFRSWTEQAKLSSNVKGGFFGRSISLSSKYSVISSYGENQQAGAIYVYNNVGEVWSQTAKLTPPDLSFGDLFGFSVDINKNNILATSLYDNAKGKYSGSAYIFSFLQQSKSWAFNSKLVASDETADDSFGYSVALCSSSDNGQSFADRDLAAVSTIYKNNSIGKTYIFADLATTLQNPSSQWTQLSALIPKVVTTQQYFGRSLTITPECDNIFVSSYGSIPENGHFYNFHVLVPKLIEIKHVNIFPTVIVIFSVGFSVGIVLTAYIKLYRAKSSTAAKINNVNINDDEIIEHSNTDIYITPSLSLFLLSGIINVMISTVIIGRTNIAFILLLSIMLLSSLPSFMFLLEVFQIKCFSTKLNCLDLIVSRQLEKGHFSNIVIILLASICGCDLLRLLPWRKNDYSYRNSGFPTYRLFQFCFGFTLLHHIGILVCLIMSSPIIPKETQYILPLTITIVLLVLRLIMILIVSFHRLFPAISLKFNKFIGYNTTAYYNNTIVHQDRITSNPFIRGINNVENDRNVEMTEKSTHPIDLEFERENLMTSSSLPANEVFMRDNDGDYINVSRNEDSPPPVIQQVPFDENSSLFPLETPPTIIDDAPLPVRVVKKRAPPKTLPPLKFKLAPKMNPDV